MALDRIDQRSANEALRPLWLQVYIPNLIIVTGQGAMLPELAIAAKHVGASSALASVIVALNGFGTMLFDLPAGRIVARFGEVRSSRLSAVLVLLGAGAAFFSRDPVMLGASVFVAACGWAIFSLVRLTHLSRIAPFQMRGRALSVFGGVSRAGQVIGPFAFAAIVESNSKSWRPAFLLYFIAGAIGFLWLALSRDRSDTAASQGGLERIRPLKIVTDNRREFATAGVGTFGISLLRASRQVVIPLWGAHLGLSSSAIAVVFGFSSIVDLSLFYPSGIVSDRFGRKVVAIPCVLILSIGHLLLPLTHSYGLFLAVALLLGFGNGMGSGIVMTLGADRAPSVGRASFLAMWRLVSDGGTTTGPLLEGGIIAVASLAVAPPVIGVIGIGCAVVIWKWMREPRGDLEVALSGDPGP